MDIEVKVPGDPVAVQVRERIAGLIRSALSRVAHSVRSVTVTVDAEPAKRQFPFEKQCRFVIRLWNDVETAVSARGFDLESAIHKACDRASRQVYTVLTLAHTRATMQSL